MTKKSKLFADKLFDSYMEYLRYDADLYDILEEICGEDLIEDTSHDYYDRSIELTPCKDDFLISEAQAEKIWKLGFFKVYVNYPSGDERHYNHKSKESWFKEKK